MATSKFKVGDNVKILNGSGIGGIAFVADTLEALSVYDFRHQINVREVEG